MQATGLALVQAMSDTLSLSSEFTVGLPHLDIYTLSEDFALAHSMEYHWSLLASSLGLKSSQWYDRKGERMYAAAIYLSTWFDLDNPISEDAVCLARTEVLAIRKPHALSKTQYLVDGTCRAEVRLLTSFVKRQRAGSNKKLSVTQDIWLEQDFGSDKIDALLEEHHNAKSRPDAGDVQSTTEINQIQDFNAANLLYFKNFVRIAKAAEWGQNRGRPPQLNMSRDCYYYGNADDGERIDTRIARGAGQGQTSHQTADGKRIFLSLWTARDILLKHPV